MATIVFIFRKLMGLQTRFEEKQSEHGEHRV